MGTSSRELWRAQESLVGFWTAPHCPRELWRAAESFLQRFGELWRASKARGASCEVPPGFLRGSSWAPV
eukprot:15474508-Alexandrium_andersonii.AAC.1